MTPAIAYLLTGAGLVIILLWGAIVMSDKGGD